MTPPLATKLKTVKALVKMFSGKATDIAVDEWLDTFTSACRVVDLTDGEKCDALPFLVVSNSPAHNFLQSKENKKVKHCGDWRLLKRQLIDRFIPTNRTQIMLQQLHTLKQEHKETITELYDRVCSLSNQFSRLDDEIGDATLKTIFINAIDNANSKLQVKTKFPQSLNEAYEIALEVEAAQNEYWTSRKGKENKSHQRNDKDKDKEKESASSSGSGSSQSGSRQGSNQRKCYNCDKPGHYSTQCHNEWKPTTVDYIKKIYGVSTKQAYDKLSDEEKKERRKGKPKVSAMSHGSGHVEHALLTPVSVMIDSDVMPSVYVSCHAQIDNGSSLTLVSRDLVNKATVDTTPTIRPCHVSAIQSPLHDDQKVQVIGVAPLVITLDGVGHKMDCHVIDSLDPPMFLGLDFLRKYSVYVLHQHPNNQVTIGDKAITLISENEVSNHQVKIHPTITSLVTTGESEQKPESSVSSGSSHPEPLKKSCVSNSYYSSTAKDSLNDSAAESHVDTPVISHDSDVSIAIYSRTPIVVPANSTTRVVIPCPNNKTYSLKPNQAFVFESLTAAKHKGLQFARVTVKDPNSPELQITNPRNKEIKLPASTFLGKISVWNVCAEAEKKTAKMSSVVMTQEEEIEDESPSKHEVKSVEQLLKERLTHLDDTQQKCVIDVLTGFKHIFLKEKEIPTTTTTLVEHEINTDGGPVHATAYRRSQVENDKIEETVGDLVEKGIVEPTNTSAWSSPVVLVMQKGKVRFCIDYRRLNEVTIKDVYPMHRVQETIDALAKAIWFTSLDLASGYWQVKVSEKDQDKTTFITRSGTYKWKVMPFGLCNAPATFQRLMNAVLSGLSWECALAYIDDIIIYSTSFDNHVNSDLVRVLTRIDEANLKIRTEKCQFAKPQVRYLSYVVGSGKIQPNEDYLKAVKEFKVKDIDTLRAFLGLTGYFRQFVKNYAKIAEPCYQLLKKTATFEWTPEREKSIQELKRLLTTDPVLKAPELDKPFIMHTDASNAAIGVTLLQASDDGVEHPVAYASRTLNKAERNYSTTEREALAVVYAFKQFRCYVFGCKQTLVLTDHHSLRFLQSSNTLSGRLARWAALLSEFEYSVQYKTGKSNGDADGLSRSFAAVTRSKVLGIDVQPEEKPAVETEKQKKDPKKKKEKKDVIEKESNLPQKDTETESTATDQSALPTNQQDKIESQEEKKEKKQEESQPLSLIDQIVAAQKEDAECMKIAAAIERPAEKGAAIEGDDVDVDVGLYVTRDSVLYRRVLRRQEKVWEMLLFVPATMRNKVIGLCHDDLFTAHQGITRTQQMLTERFYWPACAKSVESYVKTCHVCAERKNGRHAKVPLMGMPVPTAPMQFIGMDIVGPYNVTEKGNKYILTVVDYFTRYPIAIPIPDYTTENIMNAFMQHVVCVYGVPDTILTDRGAPFKSELAQAVYALINTKKIQTTAYHPQTNGLVERFHRVLNDMLSCTCAQDESNWDNVVPYAMIAYRNRKQATTGYSPNYLMFGHEINLPMDVALNNIKHDDEQFDTVEKYINTTMTRMSIANTTVKSMFDDTNEIRASVNMAVRFRVKKIGTHKKYLNT
jgi:transposase InsO family protein